MQKGYTAQAEKVLITAKNLARKWNHPYVGTEHLLLALKKEFNFIAESNQNNNKANILEGKTFVITGSLEHFKNRDELTEKIISLSGKVSGSVSAKTTALINNDINSNSSKNNKAKSLNIPILSEEDFLKMIGEF